MDTSETYVKMSYAAWPDLRDGYEPREGDYYKCSCESCRFTKRIFRVESADIIAITEKDWSRYHHSFRDHISMCDFGGFAAYWQTGKDSFFVLFQQDQLQEMVEFTKQGISNCVYRYALNSLYNFANEQMDRFSSWEQLWLAFVMKEKHGKVWNGEGWVKERE